ILGMALANAMTELFLEYFNLPMLKFQFDISYIFSAILLTSAFCAISGLFGSRGVIKITPADAMREEPPKSGKRIMLERLTPIWKRISFSRKLVLKNIFRNKKRTTFVILGVAITYAMMLFATTMPAVVDQMMNQHFTEFQKMDYNIDFYRPVGEKTVRDLKHIIDVDYAEGKIDFPFELSRGHRKQSVNIIGLTEDTHFYEFTDSSGKPQPIRSGGIILSENLSRILKAKKGDSVQVTSYLTEKRKMLIPVIGVVKQTLGMNAYMEIGEMRDILLEKGVITGVYVNTRDEAVSEKLLAATNIAATMSTRDMRAIYEEYMDIIFASIGFMLVFAGIIGFCIVYIATMISINEREGEFSSLRVLGFTKTEIFRMVRRENNIITAVGILFGIPIGQLFCRYSTVAFSTDIYTLDISPALTEGIWSGIFTIGFVVLAQAATYRKIRGLDFLQALKNRAG
ncbi:MAG TPA: FtsX-like permease family protein, partial [Anaerovoracaceae bacterium]|nr:FtsX-like permease family protein [Anaerovoracaceae bacterium]